jgi:hypothetical protein
MFKKKGMRKIKELMVIKNCIANEDKDNLLIYPEWEKTLKHKLDELEIAKIDFKVSVIKTFCKIKDEDLLNAKSL